MKVRMKCFSICLLPLILLSCGNDEAKVTAFQTVEVVHPVMNGHFGNGTLSGTVKENNTLLLSFETSGKIEQVYVSEGDYVQKGALIARLDDKDYRLAVEGVEAQFNQQKNETKRLKALYEQRALSKNEYEKSTSGLDQTRTQLDSYRNKLSYTKLYAPVSGYIQSVDFHRGEMVNAGTSIASMIDVSRLKVEVSMPSTYYMNRSSFGTVTCTCSRYPGKVYQLSDMNIVMKSDINQLYNVNFTIDGKDAKELTAGTSVEVSIPVTNVESDAFIQVPQGALVKDSKGSFVWVVSKDSTLQRRAVEMISLEGRMMRVNGELNADDDVVKAGSQTLHEGEKVRIHTTQSATNVGGLL